MSDAVHSTNSIAGRAAALRPFVCSWAKSGRDAAWMRVAGALDLEAARQLKQTLYESQSTARLVVLDVSELSFMDPDGVREIISASIHARMTGRRLVVLCGSTNVDGMRMLAANPDTVEIADPDAAEPAASNRFSARPSRASDSAPPKARRD
jgi:anti-anti-sigma factor